ncbi:MAG: insulinase family protein [Chlorobiaceae bacterium]|nr:insulinase family protein [Chlorobiaceae bacterium]
MKQVTSHSRQSPVPEDSVQQELLVNGLRVVTDSVSHVESITLGIQINSGSRDDPESAPGLAHFIEHALFKGTKKRSYIDIAKNIEKLGGYLDAFTTKEQTCIYLRCLSNHLEPSFELLADLVCDPTFPQEEMEKEKEVVIEEISSVNDNPEELIFEEFDLRSFPLHPLGRPILGSEKSVEEFTESDLKQFMREHYIPRNMMLTATGKMDHDNIVRLSERFLGTLGEEGSNHYNRQPFLAEHYTPFEVTLKKQLFQAQIVLGTATARHDPLFSSLMVLNSMLGNGMSSLLNLELREKRGLAYTIYSSLTWYDDMTALNIYAGTDSNKTKLTIELIRELLLSDALKNPDPVEVEAAKTKLLGAHIMGMEKMTRRMSQTASDIAYFGRYIDSSEKTAALEAVTPDDIANAAAIMLRDAPFSTLVYIPKR